LKLTKKLKNSKTVIAFTPKKGATLASTCGIGRYEVSITVK